MRRYASLLLPLMLLIAAPLHAQITQQVADINPNGDAHVSDSMTEFQDAVYFGADDGTTGLELWRDQLFFGRWMDGTVALTASARIEQANPMRKIVIAALVAGYCGSSGLSPG